MSGVAGVNLGEAPKNKGGSPESYQWDRIWPEIVVLAAKGQVSEVKEAFYRMLEGHLIAKGINSPSAKHMRTKLKWLHERLRDEGLTKEQTSAE